MVESLEVVKKIILVIVFGMMVLPIWAHLQGIVLDDKGEPLAGANVWWEGTTVGTATDAEGFFEIEPIRQTKVLICSYLGYRNDTTVIKDRSLIKIVMVSDEVLDEVTITERKLSVMRSRFSAFDVQTIGREELCRAACCNLSESFETNASVDVSYADAATGAKQIRLLGLSGTYVQLLGENCPAVRGLAQSYGMSYIPGPWMESIQVSKGTSSVRNGYEAIAGQINVEYLKPQLQNPIELNAMLNTDLRAEVNMTGGWDIPIPNDPMLGTLSTGVMAHYQIDRLGMDANKDGFLDRPMNQQLNILNRWYYKNDEYTFQFLVRGLHDDHWGGQRKDRAWKKHKVVFPNPPYLIDLHTDRIEGFMKNGIILDEETGMSIGIITSASYHKQQNKYGPRQWNAAQTNAYLNAMFENHWDGQPILGGKENTHSLTAGVSVNYDRYDETADSIGGPAAPRADLGRQEVTPGVFAEYTYKIGDEFSLVAGVRGDWSSRYGWFCTPRMNVRYAPFPWWTIRASAGLGYRTPNLIADNAQFMPSNRVWNYGKVKQERAVNTGLTLTFDIPLGNRNMQLSAEYYYTRFQDCVVADMDSSRYGVVLYNLSDVSGAQSFSHNAQIEATIEILRGWTMTAAFRYTDVRQTTWNSAKGDYDLRRKVLTNRFKGVITTSYVTPLKTWQFDVTAQFNGPGRLPDGLPKSRYPWYPQLMAQVTKYFKHNVSIYVGAENMTNYTQADPILGDRDAQGIIRTDTPEFDASTVWGPTTGWMLYVGMRWALDRKEN